MSFKFPESTTSKVCAGTPPTMQREQMPPKGTFYQWARMRYLRTEVPFLSTGTLNWAAQAAVLVNL